MHLSCALVRVAGKGKVCADTARSDSSSGNAIRCAVAEMMDACYDYAIGFSRNRVTAIPDQEPIP